MAEELDPRVRASDKRAPPRGAGARRGGFRAAGCGLPPPSNRDSATAMARRAIVTPPGLSELTPSIRTRPEFDERNEIAQRKASFVRLCPAGRPPGAALRPCPCNRRSGLAARRNRFRTARSLLLRERRPPRCRPGCNRRAGVFRFRKSPETSVPFQGRR